MAINPNKNIRDFSFLLNNNDLSENEDSLQQLSQVVQGFSSEIIVNSTMSSEQAMQLDKKIFNKIFCKDVTSLLSEKENKVLAVSLKSVNLLLDKLESKEKKEPSEMDNKGIKFLDISTDLTNATKELKEVKEKVFSEWEEKSELEKSSLSLESFFEQEKQELLKDKEKITKSLEVVDSLLDFVENSHQEISVLKSVEESLSSLHLDRIFLEEAETVELATQTTNNLVSSLLSIQDKVSLSFEEASIFSNKLFQLKDSSAQCIRSFSELAAFTKACSLFLKTTKESFIKRKKESIQKEVVKSDDSRKGSHCQRIKEMLFLVQRKLVQFGSFIKSLFMKLFSILSDICSSVCMTSLSPLQRKKTFQDVKLVEDLFVEGKLSFGSSGIKALANLKLFLQLFGLELLVYTEEGDINYRVVIDISDQSLEEKNTLSNIMLALSRYFENFSFEDFLFEIDRLSDVDARNVETILSNRIEDLFSHEAWLFFEDLRFSENN